LVYVRFRQELGRVRGQVSVAIGMAAGLILVGTVMFRHVMDLTWSEAFYFSVVTLTTVGYGDVTPDTDFQRVVVALYVLIGVTIFVTAISIIGVNVIEKRQAKLALKLSATNESLRVRVAKLEETVKRFRTGHKVSKDEEGPTPDEQDVS